MPVLRDQPVPTPSAGEAPPQFSQAVKSIVESGAVGGQTGASPKDPPVFLGWGQTPAGLGGFALTPKVTLPASQVTGQYYSWDQATKDKFLTQASLAGYDTQNMKDAQLAALWGNYVAQAANYYGSGQAVTPWDIMAKDRSQREAYMATPRTVTQTQKSFDLSTEGDARAIFYTAAQQLLGRDPTKAETRDFQKALNAMERANPTITKTTAQYLGDTLQSQESVTEGGVKEGARQMEAMDIAKAKPEFGAFQAATTYMDALMGAIGGIQ